MRREFSAGGVVFKKQGGQVLWLVRRPTAGKDYRGNLGWSFPKGWIDDAGEGQPGPKASGAEKAEEVELWAAALREVREEGGVEAKIVKKLQTVRFFFKNRGQLVMKFVTYFLMEWAADVPEGCGWETAEVKWMSREEAEVELAQKGDRQLLKEAAESI